MGGKELLSPGAAEGTCLEKGTVSAVGQGCQLCVPSLLLRWLSPGWPWLGGLLFFSNSLSLQKAS